MKGLLPSRFDNLFVLKTKKGERYYTKNTDGFRGFEEYLLKEQEGVYREVDPTRSKLFAGIAKGLSQTGIRIGSNVLYLGASHGYTPSFVSDLVGVQGSVLCVDIAPRVVRDLVFVCEHKQNMAPVLADCAHPLSYKEFVPTPVDVVFQDVAQKDQVGLFLRNVHAHLKQGGFGILALKARSVDVTKKPTLIFKETFDRLQRTPEITIVDKRDLYPYEKDHMVFVIKKTG